MKRTTVVLILLLAACRPPRPVPVKPPPVALSILVQSAQPGSRQPGALPDFGGIFPVGQSGTENDAFSGCFSARHDYTLKRRDGRDIDPAEVDAALIRWIEGAPGVRVTGRSGAAPGPRVVDYATAGTVGYVKYEIEPATPSPKVRYTLQVQERRR